MSTVACNGGTKDIEDNQEFDAWCSHSQAQLFFFFFKSTACTAEKSIEIQAEIDHYLEQCRDLDQSSFHGQAELNGEREERSWRQFFPRVSLQKGVEHEVVIGERNGVKRKVF